MCVSEAERSPECGMLNNAFLIQVETVVLDARDTAEYLTSSAKTHNGETMIAL